MPRLRIDQVLAFNWKFLVPLALVNLILVAFVDKAVESYVIPTFWLRPGVLILINIVIIIALIAILQVHWIAYEAGGGTKQS